MGQLRTDGTEVQPTFEVTRTVKSTTSEATGDMTREDVTRSRKAKWAGEAAEWHDAIGKAGDAFGEIPEDADEVRFTVKRGRT